MWDDPEIVPHEKCRYDVGLEVPDLIPCGEVGRIEFPAMQVAEVEVRGTIDLEMRALDWLFGTGFRPADSCPPSSLALKRGSGAHSPTGQITSNSSFNYPSNRVDLVLTSEYVG